MKTISSDFKAHLGKEVTTLATCWKMKRRDGEVLGFTDHDINIVYDEVTYLAASGFTPSAIGSTAALSVDNLEMAGMLDADIISEPDLLSGLYDYAQVDIFWVNYEDLSQGHMMLRSGWIGEVRLVGNQFSAELRGLTQQLNTRIGEHYTPSCRADLADARCKVNLPAITYISSVTAGGSNTEFTDSSRTQDAGFFSQGKVLFAGGANEGLSMEIKEFKDGRFVLALPMPHLIEEGVWYNAIPGCDKTLATCISKFNNAVNFRGEPHVPGTDKILETSATRNI